MIRIEFLKAIGERSSIFGSIIALMGCAMCFPAFASLGAAIGMGFLSQWEGLFINTLLPIFAVITLIINLLGYFLHKQIIRTLFGIVGPILLLLSLYPWFQYEWSTYVTYSAIAIMVLVSLWDIFSPANKRCTENSCDIHEYDIEKR